MHKMHRRRIEHSRGKRETEKSYLNYYCVQSYTERQRSNIKLSKERDQKEKERDIERAFVSPDLFIERNIYRERKR